MKINLYDILESQNRSPHSLAKEIDCDYHNLLRLCSGDTTKISLTLLEKICNALNCTPNDIFGFEHTEKESHRQE